MPMSGWVLLRSAWRNYVELRRAAPVEMTLERLLDVTVRVFRHCSCSSNRALYGLAAHAGHHQPLAASSTAQLTTFQRETTHASRTQAAPRRPEPTTPPGRQLRLGCRRARQRLRDLAVDLRGARLAKAAQSCEGAPAAVVQPSNYRTPSDGHLQYRALPTRRLAMPFPVRCPRRRLQR